MDTRPPDGAPTSSRAQARNTQRTVLACTECVRRKIRCSKTIPCAACVRHHKADHCHREAVTVVTRGAAAARASPRERGQQRTTPEAGQLPRTSSGGNSTARSLTASSAEPATAGTPRHAPPRAAASDSPHATPPVNQHVPGLSDLSSEALFPTFVTGQSPASRLTDKAASALEYLAHGRRNVLRRFLGRGFSGESAFPTSTAPSSASDAPFHLFFAVDVSRLLLATHQTYLAWMHMVVHLPTFRQQFEINAMRGSCDKSWAALYYAILSQTVYHVVGTPLLPPDLVSNASIDTARALFDKSIDLLYQDNFLAEHKLSSVQTICLLLQVAHNFDKSDLICVLVSSAIRISQCLNIHRLGPDNDNVSAGTPGPESADTQGLVNREVEKRVWWYLVRYDWLQIPFQNIYQVHPAQFDTAMPADCLEEAERMVQDGVVVSQPDSVCTTTRWGTVLNRVSGLIWEHQDKMSKVVPQGDEPTHLTNLYEQVIWADGEIKRAYITLPLFMREVDASAHQTVTKEGLPVLLMPGLVLLCTAHKILNVHRQFQLSGFRDRRFAFTQLSCFSIAERALVAVREWPDSAEVRVARRMWTTLTHVISCSVTLIFALLFKNENLLVYDAEKLRALVAFAKDFLREEEQVSSIAGRGVKLISALMDLEHWSEYSVDIEADMGEMMRRVAASDDRTQDSNRAGLPSLVCPPLGQDFWESLLTNGAMFPEDLMDGNF